MAETNDQSLLKQVLSENVEVREYLAGVATSAKPRVSKSALTRAEPLSMLAAAAGIALLLIVRSGIDYVRGLGDLQLTRLRVKLVEKLVEESTIRKKQAAAIVEQMLEDLRSMPQDHPLIDAFVRMQSRIGQGSEWE